VAENQLENKDKKSAKGKEKTLFKDSNMPYPPNPPSIALGD